MAADMAKPKGPSGSSGGGDDGGPPRKRPGSGGGSGGDSGTIRASQDRIAEAERLGNPDGGGSPASAPGQVTGPAARIPLRPPNSRHNLNSIRPKNPAKDRNTVVLPGTDVAGDLADISAGRGTWRPESNTYEVNGRSYGVETLTGTTYPVSGPGLVNLSRSEYKVLQQLIGSEGDIGTAREALRRNPSISEADWSAALEVFKHHKSYKGGA